MLNNREEEREKIGEDIPARGGEEKRREERRGE